MDAKIAVITCVCATLLILSDAAAAASGGCVRKQLTTPTTNATATGFVGRKGMQFVKNGKPFHFNGFNAYWLMLLASNNSTRDKVSTALTLAAKVGMTVGRTWAFNDGGSFALQKSPGVYDENMFRGLDYVVSEAKKNGIYLVLGLVNNYADLGGRKQYVQWAREKGEQVNNEDDFYTNPTIKSFFKNHIMAVLTRVNSITGVAYKEEAAILSWELMNEPRNQIDSSGKTVEAWTKEMSAYLKSIDGKHLLGIGLEGFYGESRKQINPHAITYGTDFIAINIISQIDWTSIHLYPDGWLEGQNDTAKATFATTWIQMHANDSKSLGKPLVLGEFGKSSRSNGYTVEARDGYYRSIYGTIYECAKGRGPCGGALVWQLLAEGMDNYGDGFEVVLGRSPSTDDIITGQSHRISALDG